MEASDGEQTGSQESRLVFLSHVEAIAKAVKRDQRSWESAWLKVLEQEMQTAKWCVSWETTMRRRDHRDPVELAELHRVLFF